MNYLQRILVTATTFSVVAALGLTSQAASPSNLWCEIFPNAWFCTN